MGFISYTMDNLSAFFLTCFGIGLLTTLGSLLLGVHGHGDAGSHGMGHHGGGESGHGSIHGNSGNEGSTAQGSSTGGTGLHSNGQVSHHVSVFNLNILLAFLLGFGAAGFIIRQVYMNIPLVFDLIAAGAGGVIFAYLVYLLLAKVLVQGQSPYLNAADFNPVGAEGTVSSTIFANRIGEISYILNGSYTAMPAQGRDGREIKKGESVVIIEVKNGVAVVISRDEFAQYAYTEKN